MISTENGTAFPPLHRLEAVGPAWLGADDCLYSFDGYDLVSFPYSEGPLTIQCILFQEDHLLLGTDRGLFSFDPW